MKAIKLKTHISSDFSVYDRRITTPLPAPVVIPKPKHYREGRSMVRALVVFIIKRVSQS